MHATGQPFIIMVLRAVMLEQFLSIANLIQNQADLDGGVIFNDGRYNGKAIATFKDGFFQSNEANYGGACMNYGGAGDAQLILTDCTFLENTAYVKGATFYNVTVEGDANINCHNCHFKGNQPTDKVNDIMGILKTSSIASRRK